MNSKGFKLLNTVILFLILFLVSGIQTTLWYQIFGLTPAPHFWLVIIVYVILYRPSKISIFLVYLMGFSILGFTATSLGMLFVNILAIYLVVSTLKNRFYWGGVGYFSLLCLIASLVFHLAYVIASLFIETNMTEILFFSRLTQGMLTPLVAIIFYPILKKLDQWTLSEELAIELAGPEQ